jgi:hypothetical protein
MVDFGDFPPEATRPVMWPGVSGGSTSFAIIARRTTNRRVNYACNRISIVAGAMQEEEGSKSVPT